MKLDQLVAIDTHVHIEPDPTGNAAEEAARKYFGNTGVSYSRKDLAEYYRSRNIGCVVFSVDERLALLRTSLTMIACAAWWNLLKRWPGCSIPIRIFCLCRALWRRERRADRPSQHGLCPRGILMALHGSRHSFAPTVWEKS